MPLKNCRSSLFSLLSSVPTEFSMITSLGIPRLIAEKFSDDVHVIIQVRPHLKLFSLFIK
jgi:hypothetical protein